MTVRQLWWQYPQVAIMNQYGNEYTIQKITRQQTDVHSLLQPQALHIVTAECHLCYTHTTLPSLIIA